MRISDWISDVCSSDLAPVAVDVIGNMEEVIWYSHRSGWGHLYRYDARTGRMLNAITQGDWLVRDLIDVDANRGRVLFTASGREGGKDRKSVVSGKRVSVRVDLGGRRNSKKKTEKSIHRKHTIIYIERSTIDILTTTLR